jgi:hypothetical protein
LSRQSNQHPRKARRLSEAPLNPRDLAMDFMTNAYTGNKNARLEN